MSERNLFDVRGKTALVTGGTAGIGFMIAKALVQNGCKVYITSRKASMCAQAAAALAEFGECVALSADISDLDQVQQLAAEIAEREKELHVLFNNAGTTWGAAIEAVTPQSWDKVLNLNLRTPFFLIQKFLPLICAAATAGDPGRIVNIGSIDGMRTSDFEHYAYSASKAGLHHLTRTLAARLAPNNLTVNAIAPGFFTSKMLAPMIEKADTALEARVPLGHLGRYEDMAGVALFLSSRASAYMTGTVVTVDGGLLISP